MTCSLADFASNSQLFKKFASDLTNDLFTQSQVLVISKNLVYKITFIIL